MGVEVFAECYLSLINERWLEDLSQLPTPFFPLGEGSNVLFCKDINGTVLHNKLLGITLKHETDDFALIEVMGGENWHQFIKFCVKNGWYGLEPLALIPGTVGAAPVQNIGAYGYEVKEFIDSINAFDFRYNRWVTFKPEECDFSYRDSLFKKERGRFLISRVTFRLKKSPQVVIRYPVISEYLKAKEILNPTPHSIYRAVVAIRKGKLPNPKTLPNAGSFFKNPIITKDTFIKLKEAYPQLVSYEVDKDSIKLAAGQLIDLAGFKGKRKGGVGMYDKQALILVNFGKATGETLYQYSQQVAKQVFTIFGVELEPEPLIVR